MRSDHRTLPPEWAPQSGVMLTWPHEQTDWQASLTQIEPVLGNIAREISRREKVLIVYNDSTHKKHVCAFLESCDVAMEHVLLHEAPSNDIWARDHGPITVINNGKPWLLDFKFNGWGAKHPFNLDNRITTLLHADGTFNNVNVDLNQNDLVLEGGSIDTDGNGTLLTTKSCLLTGNRNPRLDQERLEDRLQQSLGVQQILWLENGYLRGDDTDGHIDMLSRFCDADTICYIQCNDHNDEHYEPLRAMEEELETFSNINNQSYKLVPLPFPEAKYDQTGQRLPASYANFLIINEAVLVPEYYDPSDAIANDILQQCFPDRTIIPVPCLPLIQQSGSLHCVTMQFPVGVL